MNSEQRRVCWSLKDQLYQCMDTSEDNLSKCEIQYEQLIYSCPKSWVKRYVEKRKFDKEYQATPKIVQEDEETTRQKLLGSYERPRE